MQCSLLERSNTFIKTPVRVEIGGRYCAEEKLVTSSNSDISDKTISQSRQ